MWGNLQFWEAAYYQDVQRAVQCLYVPPPPRLDGRGYSVIDSSGAQFGALEADRDPAAPSWRQHERRTTEPAALELAADQLRTRTQLEDGEDTEDSED